MTTTNIPAPRVDFVDARTGLISREWYRFLLNLFSLTGSGSSDVTTVQLDAAVQGLQSAPAPIEILGDQALRTAKSNKVLLWLSM